MEEVAKCTTECLLYLPLAVIPSIIWLAFFVAQDKHKEKFKNLLRIFIWGIVISAPVVFIEATFEKIFLTSTTSLALSSFLYSFVAIALVEETAKYLVVKLRAVPYKFFNEPQDAMVYMITAALGFAAIENIVYAVNLAPQIAANTGVSLFSAFVSLTIFRGITSTFLHAVASGAVGYFLALSIFHAKEKKKFLYSGIVLATLLHGVYNNFIMDIENRLQAGPAGGAVGTVFVSLLLVISGIIILIGFRKLLKAKS